MKILDDIAFFIATICFAIIGAKLLSWFIDAIF